MTIANEGPAATAKSLITQTNVRQPIGVVMHESALRPESSSLRASLALDLNYLTANDPFQGDRES